MEPVRFGSDAWKNHPRYDDRFEDDDSYNEDFQKRYQVGRYASIKKIKPKQNKNYTTYTDEDGTEWKRYCEPDDDFRPW